jgi:AcrR family transcriptional regulator
MKLSVIDEAVKCDTLVDMGVSDRSDQPGSQAGPVDRQPPPVDRQPGPLGRQGRQGRRRARTRARLLAAASSLFARQGVDNTRINQITEEADVGFGSFYNHFVSKDAILQAVLEDTIAARGEAIAAATAELEDPAQVIAAAHRYFMSLNRSHPDWAWLLVRLHASHQVASSALGPFALRDLRRGIRAGRLDVPDEKVALSATGGALLADMRAVLDGTAPRDADVYHAELVLRMLGLPAAEAAEVARRPLPKLPAARAKKAQMASTAEGPRGSV